MNIFLTSDHHFTHANTLTFMVRDRRTGACGYDEQQCDDACKASHPEVHMRSFASVEEMDETMVDRWNKVVRPQDHVWHLGDVALKKPHLAIVKRLNGHKRLVPGNHDIFDVRDYIKAGFEKMQGMRVFEDPRGRILCTHIPVHPSSIGRFVANVHGHVHNNQTLPHPYINVCVEVTDYTPVALETIKARL